MWWEHQAYQILSHLLQSFNVKKSRWKVRNGVKSIKKIKGKAGKPDKVELIVNLDLVNILKDLFNHRTFHHPG